MKTLKLAFLSFVVGVALSAYPILTHACASMLWVQSEDNCNMYDRYVLNGSSSNGEVEVCSYGPSGGSQHYESGSCGDLPYVM